MFAGVFKQLSYLPKRVKSMQSRCVYITLSCISRRLIQHDTRSSWLLGITVQYWRVRITCFVLPFQKLAELFLFTQVWTRVDQVWRAAIYGAVLLGRPPPVAGTWDVSRVITPTLFKAMLTGCQKRKDKKNPTDSDTLSQIVTFSKSQNLFAFELPEIHRMLEAL